MPGGFGFWVAPAYSTSEEGLFTYNWDVDLNAGGSGHSVVPGDLKKLFITPAAPVDLFPTTAVSPSISLGAGLGHVSLTGAVIEAGMGLDVKFWRKLSMRGGVRDFWAGQPDFPLSPSHNTWQHHFLVSSGAFWRF